jgi:YfiH family protein
MSFRPGKDFHNIEAVRKNLKVVSEECGFDYKSIIRPDIEHTANVQIVDLVESEDDGPELRGNRYKDIDGLLTNKSGITLMTTNADCSLILLYDPVKRIIGNIHAGWRSTFGKIAKNAIIKMKEEYDCNPANIEAYFCPSIRKCHFEVDTDVMEICKNVFSYTNRLDDIIFKGDIKDGKQKYLIDTVLINKMLLEEEGVLQKNIFDSGICSVCQSSLVHSKRAEGDLFGLGAAFISIS